MELKKKIVFIIILIVGSILILNTSSYAGTQSWNALDYDVTVNPDGSMDVIETWDVYISETNTLFKDFDMSDGDYNITDVKIVEVDEDREKTLKQIYEEQYHVDQGCYYGLDIDSSTFEIAWHVGLDNSSDDRIYKMYYTVENAVKVYNDCAEVYWQFLSDENTMYGENVTGTIKLPEGVTNLEKLRVWAHGDYEGIIEKDSKNTVSFSLDTIRANRMLEIRIVTEENIYKNSTNLYGQNELENILAEEKKWADEANAEREEAKEFVETIKKIFIVVVVINILIFIVFMSKLKKIKAAGKELKEAYSYSKNENEYFRDIPDEKNATPARASYLYEFKNNTSNISSNISKIFSATMLDLSLKGIIGFEAISEKEVRIFKTENSQKNSILLSEDELIVYNLLKDAMKENEYITPNQFSKYAAKEYENVYTKLNRLESVVKKYQESIGNISTERTKLSKEWNTKFVIYMLLAIGFSILFWIVPSVILGFSLLSHACRKNSLYVSILTSKGNIESAQWKGLKKYMEDYSMLEDKLVPDIVLWEKYLVYATVFGISKKVIKQLKSVHPEMFDASINNYNRYSYWNMMTNPNFGENAFDNFSRSLANVSNEAQSAYNIAHSSSSSGSGGGGGFSGGGGGRWWRRKLWRTLKN